MLCNYVLTTKLCCVIATITMREGLNSKMRTPSKHINEEAITGRFHAAFNNAPSSLFLFNSEVRKNITYTSMITSCYTFRVSARAKVCSESSSDMTSPNVILVSARAKVCSERFIGHRHLLMLYSVLARTEVRGER